MPGQFSWNTNLREIWPYGPVPCAPWTVRENDQLKTVIIELDHYLIVTLAFLFVKRLFYCAISEIRSTLFWLFWINHFELTVKSPKHMAWTDGSSWTDQIYQTSPHMTCGSSKNAEWHIILYKARIWYWSNYDTNGMLFISHHHALW